MKSLLVILEVLNLIESIDDLDPIQAFQIRILLIHQYRRILLKDPNLPFELLPSNWLSLTARNLSSNVYQIVFIQQKIFLELARTSEGSMPPAHPQFYKRFGGFKTGSYHIALGK